MHRRKGSKENAEVATTLTVNTSDYDEASEHVSNGYANGNTNGNGLHDHQPNGNNNTRAPRERTVSTPTAARKFNGLTPSPLNPNPPPSAGPFRTGFNIPPSPGFAPNARSGTFPPSSPFRTSFQAPPSPNGMPGSPGGATGRSHRRANSSISILPAPMTSEPPSASSSLQPPASPSPSNMRHSRIHSRNLSIFFPRPGATAQASIAEDGAQEIEVEAPIDDIPSAGPRGTTDVRAGLNNFSFGRARGGAENGGPGAAELNSAPAKRRGHHHKHSLSHNFFSFMDPQTISMATPTPTSTTFPNFSSSSHLRSPSVQWDPVSPFPPSATSPSFGVQGLAIPSNGYAASKPSSPLMQSLPNSSQMHGPSLLAYRGAEIFAAAQFLVGAFTWVEGQRRSSLACTGLGYWVVFDSIGVVVGQLRKLVPEGESLKRPYG